MRSSSIFVLQGVEFFVCTVLRLQHRYGYRDGPGDEGCPDTEREVVSARKRYRGRLTVPDEFVAAGRREGREHRQAEGAAYLGCGIDQAGGEPCVL
ncbi:hypothetical protein [Rubrobacter radiotolerans]|uniref:Secreted protein n=1 Tax=Rubrobacter radiotolerans TaxID=42256 RepID=A0AB35TBL5_RUBRA|nr:hypothetical protein [Rubrobacter radiotolerans]MDX5895411.1 hypothetical protein [Rubrobacter radiotolerans]